MDYFIGVIQIFTDKIISVRNLELMCAMSGLFVNGHFICGAFYLWGI